MPGPGAAASSIHKLLAATGIAALLAGTVLQILAGNSSGGVSSIHARGLDDAYISYQYARNLVDGHGLVFNPGERVEGFSNPLAVLLAAVITSLFGTAGIYWLFSFFHLGLLLAAALLFHHLLGERLDALRASLATFLLGFSPLLWAWTASGIETIQVVALQITAWALATRKDPSTKSLLASSALCILVRADGFLIPASLILFFLLNRRFRAALHGTVVLGALLVLRLAASYAYYGDVLPTPSTRRSRGRF